MTDGLPRRVLISTVHYAPDLIGCAKYTAELAEALVDRGYRVEVVAPPPFYPAWRRGEGYRPFTWRTEIRCGVLLHRVPVFIPRHPGGLARLVHLASFSVTGGLCLLMRALRFRPQLVLTIAPTMALAPAGLVAAKLSGARSWVHVQDFELDAAFELGMLEGRAARKIAEAVEARLLRSHDLASSISPAMVARLRTKGVAPERTLELRNWADPDVHPLGNRPSEYRSQLGISPDAFVGLYSGNMAAKQGIEVLAEVARRLEDALPGSKLVLCGDGPLRPRLQELCDGLGNVCFLPLQPRERLGELLAVADVHLLPQRREAADLVLPSKLTGMLASGRPVICGAEPGTDLHKEVEGCGVCVEPDNAGAMTDALVELAADRERRDQLGAAARRRAELRWSQGAILAELEPRLAELLPLTEPSRLPAEASR